MPKKILTLISLFALALALSSCVQPSPPQAKFVEAKVAGMNTQGVEINFFFDVENSNPVPIDVSQYSYKIFINENLVLSKVQGGFNLPASGKKLIKIPATATYEGIFGSAASVLQRLASNNNTVDYRIEGTLSAGAMGVFVQTPIQAAGKLDLPRNIQL